MRVVDQRRAYRQDPSESEIPLAVTPCVGYVIRGSAQCQQRPTAIVVDAGHSMPETVARRGLGGVGSGNEHPERVSANINLPI